MKRRTMPAKFWERGRRIVAAGNVEIEKINRINYEVEATVFGTQAYKVFVREELDQDDYCDCPFFEGHGYCKHIAAVIELLKQQHRPLEQLFGDQVDSENQNTTEAFRFYKDRETRMAEESGNLFLENLQLPARQYFKLPVSETKRLTIEVTLQIAEINQANYEYHDRFLITLRVGDVEEQKFYIVSDIDRFLAAYENANNYQTGGKRQFELRKESFSTAEQQLLDYLILSGREALSDNIEFDKAKYFLIPTNSVAHILSLCNVLPLFYFQPDLDGPRYQQIEQKKFAATDRLLLGQIKRGDGGYNLSIQTNFQLYLDLNMLLINQNKLCQLDLSQAKMITEILNRYYAVTNELERYQRLRGKASSVDVLFFPTGSEAQLNQFIELFNHVGVMSAPDELSVSAMTPHFDLSKDKDVLKLQLTFEYVEQNSQVKRNLVQEKQARQYLTDLDFYSDDNDNHWEKEFLDADVLYDFFVRELPSMRENGVVTVSDQLAEMLQEASDITPAVNVSERDGFLTVDFSFDGIAEKEVDSILAQLENVQRPFIEQPDGSIILLNDSFKKVSTALARIRQQGKLKNGQMRVHASQALALQSALGETAQFDQKFRQLTHNLAHPDEFELQSTEPIQANIRPYQKVGIQWLEMLNSYNFGGILADEMGLGKTLQMIAFLVNHLETGKTTLIVSPASLIYNWQAEFKKFSPDTSVIVVDGSKNNRREIIEAGQADVLISSYNSVRSDIDEYRQMAINYLVLDEAQFVKNSSTKTSQSLRKLTPKNTFALSGTPIENRVEELWSIFEIVMPGLLPSKKAFKKLTPEEVAVRVKPFIMRREKATVLKELPEKVESNLYNELTKEQKTVYLAQLKQMQVKVKGMTRDAFVKNKLEILAGLTRLRQICDTPALYLEDYHADSGKLEQLKDILQQAQDSNRHVLIFSQFTSMLNIIKQKLTEQRLDTYMIQGNTKPKDRLTMVNEFNAGKKIFS